MNTALEAKSKVFISYSRKQYEFAKALFDALEADRFDAWLDKEDIPHTSDWWKEIRDGIDGADSFIFIMTGASVCSAVCILELAYARDQGKRIVHILRELPDEKTTSDSIAKIEPDDILLTMLNERTVSDLAKENWRFLHQHDWIDFREHNDFSTAFERLKAALQVDLAHVKLHTRLLMEALRWRDNPADLSRLISGQELNEAENWLQYNSDKNPLPTEDHRVFIAASQAEREKQRQWAVRRRRITMAVSVVVAIVTSLLALAAFVASNDATRNLHESRTNQSLFLADLSRQELERGQPQNALLLALESLAHYDEIFNPESKTALIKALNAPVDELLTLRHITTMSSDFLDGNIDGASWSPDESRILSWSSERMWLWSANGEPIASPYGGRSIVGASWNQDGSMILSWGVDVQLWDGHTGEFLKTFVHPEYENGAVLTHDKRKLLTWGSDGTARVWNVQTGQQLLTLSHENEVKGAIWSQDENRILTWSRDGHTIIWDAQEGSKLFDMIHQGAVVGAKWNTTENKVLTWAKATEHSKPVVTIWDTIKREPLLSLEHQSDVSYATWNRAETRLLTVSLNTVYLWDTFSGEQLVVFPHDEWAYDVSWNSDETIILTRAGNSAWLWKVDGELLWQLTHEDMLNGVQWSDDFSRVLTWSADKTIRIWNAYDGTQQSVMAQDTGISGAEWSADEQSILSWAGNELKVWALNPSYELVDETLPVTTLINLGFERVKRPLSNEERTQFFLPTLVPSPTYLPQEVQIESGGLFQFALTGVESSSIGFEPIVGTPLPPLLPIYGMPLSTYNLATQVSEPSPQQFNVSQYGAMQVDLNGLDRSSVVKSLSGVYEDFTLRAKLLWGPGDNANSCGIIFRQTSRQNYYAATISRLGGSLEVYALIDGERHLINRGRSGWINTDQDEVNEMVLIAQGGHFSIFVNGNFVFPFDDDTFSVGQLGLIAETPGRADIAFCTLSDITVITDADQPSIIATPAANDAVRAEIVTDGRAARIRSQPNENSATIANLESGSMVEILNEQENWYQVRLEDGRVGWVAITLVMIP